MFLHHSRSRVLLACGLALCFPAALQSAPHPVSTSLSKDKMNALLHELPEALALLETDENLWPEKRSWEPVYPWLSKRTHIPLIDLLHEFEASLSADRGSAPSVLFAARYFSEAEKRAMALCGNRIDTTAKDRKEHLDYLHVAAVAARAQQGYARSVEYYRMALALLHQGENPTDYAFEQWMLANALCRDARTFEARSLYRVAQAEFQRARGPGEENAAAVGHALALALLADGQLPEAAVEEKAALAIDLRVLGPEDPQTLRTMLNLACILLKQDKLDEARPLMDRAYPVAERVLPRDDPRLMLLRALLSVDPLRAPQSKPK